MTINKASTKAIARRAESALQELAAEMGMAVKYKGGSYDHASFTARFEFVPLAEDGTAITPERVEWERSASYLSLMPEWLDQSFARGGRTFTVVGLNLRARKYPVLAADANGKVYKFPAATVRKGFGFDSHVEVNRAIRGGEGR